jgi:hypothetical protein
MQTFGRLYKFCWIQNFKPKPIILLKYANVFLSMQTYNKSHGEAESLSIVPSKVTTYIVVNQRLEERLFLWL